MMMMQLGAIHCRRVAGGEERGRLVLVAEEDKERLRTRYDISRRKVLTRNSSWAFFCRYGFLPIRI